jgi:cell division septum initiation protein DivIVA
MAISTTQLKRLQEQIKKLRTESARLRKQLQEKKGRNRRLTRSTLKARRIVKLGGLWKGTPEITEQDIAQARASACLEDKCDHTHNIVT